MNHRNVILICLDTVRKDYFENYAPKLQKRADLDFEQCRAASSWSVPSHASMFTGELPHLNGIHTHNRDFSNISQNDTFLGELPDHQTIGTSANVWASSSFGFDNLFDNFSDISPDRRFPEGLDVARWGQQCDRKGVRRYLSFIRDAIDHDNTLGSVANGFFVQLDNLFSQLPIANPFDDGASIITREAKSQVAETTEPFFLFANFMDAHGPLSHVKGYDSSLHNAPLSWTSEDIDWRKAVKLNDVDNLERYKGLYSASIDYLDQQVSNFIDWLDENTVRETTVVITSDHGDELGSGNVEDRWGHVESSLSEGLLHVPLLVVNAPSEWTAIDESRYVSHLSLGELLVGLANNEVPDITSDYITAERIGHSGRLATIDEHRGTEGDRMIRCVYEDDTKFVWDSQGGRAIYQVDLSQPCWQEQVEGDFDPDEFTEYFEKELTNYKNNALSKNENSKIGEATRNRLEELGYV